MTSSNRTAQGTLVAAPHKFLVHEVGEAAEEQPEWHAAGDIVVDPEPWQSLLARQIEDAERGADHPAVEAHAAIPQLQNVDRMLEVEGQIVEQHIAHAPAEDDPERRIEDQVVCMAAGHRRAGLIQQLQQIPIADEDSGEIGEAVPAKLEPADLKNGRLRPRSGKAIAVDAATVDTNKLMGFPSSLTPHRVA